MRRSRFSYFSLAIIFSLILAASGTAYAAGPSISSLNPTSGTVGIPVTINSSNGSTAASVSSWSTTKIVPAFPASARLELKGELV